MQDIHIVYLNYLSKDDVLRSVTSLFLDIKDSQYKIAITVGDNSENKDGLKEALAEQFPTVHYHDSQGNVGYGKGNMLAAKTVESRYTFFLNCDTVIPKDTHVIDHIITFMDTHPKVGVMGTKLLNIDGSYQDSCYRFSLPAILVKPLRQVGLEKRFTFAKRAVGQLLMNDFDHESTRPVDWVLGASLIVRKEALEEVGGYDDRYFMYLEDCDLCHRMWDAGWPVYYVHDIAIEHKHARESAKIRGVLRALLKNRLARIHTKSWLKYLWKWRGTYKYYAN